MNLVIDYVGLGLEVSTSGGSSENGWLWKEGF